MELVDEIALPGKGVVLTMGKGGVGKTTVAAAVAVELARRGHRVHLTTTDPAAHVASAVGKGLPGLTVSRIDPKAETEAYRAEVMATAGADLDAQGRALLEEDLRSPCTEEIAVFRAFAQAVDEPEDLVTAIRTAYQGEIYIYPSLTKTLVADFLGRAEQEHGADSIKGLTSRESVVLALLAEGLSNDRIADRLSISKHTVARHRENIMRKLGLHSRSELVKFAIRKGLINP